MSVTPPGVSGKRRWPRIALGVGLGLLVVLVMGFLMTPRMERAIKLQFSDPEVELLITADRPDTKRTDRWRLKLRESFVVSRFPRTPHGTGAYTLDLLLGRDRAPTITDSGADIVRVLISDFIQRPPELLAQDEAQRLERGCRKAKDTQSAAEGAWGLMRYEVPREAIGEYCAFAGLDYSVFAAGSAPGRYEVVIDCRHKTGTKEQPPALGVCTVHPFNIQGWGVTLRFDARHLPRWRDVVRQSLAFLQTHTIESTTGLPSTDLGWVTAAGR